MSDIAVEVEDISDDEKPIRNISTDVPTDRDAAAEDDVSSKLGEELSKSTIDSDRVESSSDQFGKTIEMCMFECTSCELGIFIVLIL